MAAFLPLTYAFLDQRTRAKLRIDMDPLEEGVVQREDLLVDWGGDAKVRVRKLRFGARNAYLRVTLAVRGGSPRLVRGDEKGTRGMESEGDGAVAKAWREHRRGREVAQR
jgi:hypothetical protein